MLAIFSLTACFSEQIDEQQAQGSTVFTTGEGDTTRKPFVEAQTEIISGESEALQATERETELFVQEINSWPKHSLLDGVPKVSYRKIRNAVEYKTSRGTRYLISLENFSYSEYLSYLKKLEKAGFNDYNSRANVPEAEPRDVAMFYYSFDGERSFGVYWYGEESQAGVDCQIVICDYDQAK